jgi:mono/diheme cytochrome c family protein
MGSDEHRVASGVWAALGAFALSACAADRTGATEGDLMRAGDRASSGARTFALACSHCHGRRGEGTTFAPAILGPSALPEYARAPTVARGFAFQDPQDLEIAQQTRSREPATRNPFRSARDLYDYVTGHGVPMGFRRLSPADGWDVVSFIAVAQGVSVPPEGVTPANASTVRLRPGQDRP